MLLWYGFWNIAQVNILGIMKKFVLFFMLLYAGIQLFPQQPASKQGQDSIPNLYVITQSATRFFSDTGNLSSVISIIPKGEKVQILEEKGDYFITWHEGKEGYILRSNVEFEPETLKYLEKVWAAREEAKPAPAPTAEDRGQALEARKRYLVGKYGDTLGMKIFNHAVWRGMDKQMVWDSWGKPRHMYRDYSGWDTQEKWIYSTAELIFIDGVLRDWVRLK
jgi:hypothetical protein